MERFVSRLPGPLDFDRQADSGLARQFKYGVNDFARQSKIARLKFLQQCADVVFVLMLPGRNQYAGQTGIFGRETQVAVSGGRCDAMV